MDLLSGVLATVPIWLWTVIVGIAVYWYLTKDFKYWSRLGIPQTDAVPLFGSLLAMLTKHMHEVELERYMKYGRIYGNYEGRTPVLTVGVPEIIKNIFIKDFPIFSGRRRFDMGHPIFDNMLSNIHGEQWRRVRMVMTPAFSSGKLKRMISIFADSAKNLSSNLKTSAKDEKPIDAKHVFGAFTMDVIAGTAFATKLDSHNDPENPFVTSARNAFSNPSPWRFALFFLFPGLMRLFGMLPLPRESITFFENATLKLVEERKKTKERRNDFLQIMLDAVEREEKETEDITENEETREMGHDEANEQIFSEYQSSRTLSNIELVANSVVFFLGGYETTSSTLTYTAYELALNPDIQERAIEEIDEAIGQKGGVNYEALCEMKYLDNIISETLRKYPPSARTERVAEEDYEIKDPSSNISLTVPKGMVINIPIYALHHDPEHYPDPEKYDPDRFSHEQRSDRHPFAYIPFGAGPRNCVGMRFALMEIKVCLAIVLSQFRFRTCPETTIPIQYTMVQGLMQPKEVVLKIEVRSDGNKL